MENIPSICIPSIEKNITRTQLKNVFEKFGEVDKINITKSKKHISAFIFIRNWDLEKEKTIKFYKKIIEGEEVNLIYDFPWFWKCRANHDIRELQFNKLKNKTKKQEEMINKLNQENWKLKSYTRWLGSRSI